MALKLELGKTYITRDGGKVKIVKRCDNIEWPWIGDNNIGYMENGRAFRNDECSQDIIKEVLDSVKPDDGGPAFPESGSRGKAAGGEGASMRDYFAAKVLPSAYEQYCIDARIKGFDEDWKMGVALEAYTMADAMLRARGQS